MLGAWMQDVCFWNCCLFIILVLLLIFKGFQMFSKLQWEKELTTDDSTSPLVILEGDQKLQDEWQDDEEVEVDTLNFQEKNRSFLKEMEKRLEHLRGLLERTKMDCERELGDLSEPQHPRDFPATLFQPLPERYLSIPALREQVEQVCHMIETIKRNLMEMRDFPTDTDTISDLERRIIRIEQEVQKQDSEQETWP